MHAMKDLMDRLKKSGLLPGEDVEYPRSFRGYLFNRVRYHARSLWPRPWNELPKTLDGTPEPTSHGPGPAQSAELREMIEVVREAVLSLPDDCGPVVALFYLCGQSYKEIAEQLSIPTSTVGTKLLRGRIILRKDASLGEYARLVLGENFVEGH
jgi:RNA polymerase sigma factor (sigma-70 family)